MMSIYLTRKSELLSFVEIYGFFVIDIETDNK